MAKMSKNAERRAIDKVFIMLGSAMAVLLIVIGALAWYGYTFASGMVTDQLSAQHIYFPAKDTAGFTSLPVADQKAIEPYAGQQLVNGEQARVYADNYIAVHIDKMADGKTYAEVSEESMKDPSNAKLQGLKTALFQGETLRGMLLGSGYAFWMFGMIAKFVALAAFVGAIFMTVFVMLGVRHLKKS